MPVNNAYKYDCTYFCLSDEMKHDDKFTQKMNDWAEILRKAREAGLSYGQYVAKMESEKQKQCVEKQKQTKATPSKGIYGVYRDNILLRQCVGYEDVADFLGVSLCSVRAILKNGYCGEYRVKTLKKRERNRPLYQLDGETRALLAHYDSPTQAAKQNNYRIQCIVESCKFGRKRYGYYWVYCDDYDEEAKPE